MNRMTKTVGSSGMLLSALAALHGFATDTHAVDVLDLNNFRVVYEHTAFNGTPPAIFSPPHSNINDSAYYSLRGLTINPTGGSDGGPSVYTTWLHGFGSRWIQEHDLSSLGDASAPAPTNAARLFSDFTTRQSQPKSVAIDDRGVVYTPIRNGAAGSSDPISEVFIYGQDLDGSGPSYPSFDTAPRGLIDIDATFPDPQFLAEGVGTDGNQWLYVTTRFAGEGRLARYDISDSATEVGGPDIGSPPVLDLAFGNTDLDGDAGILTIPNSGSLRGVAVGSDGTVYLADRDSSAIVSVDPVTEAITLQSVSNLSTPEFGLPSPHHLTLVDVDGVEMLVVTDRARLLVIPTSDFGVDPRDGDLFQVVNFDFPGGIDISPDETGRRPYGFGQIDSHESTLYWTYEDVSIAYDQGLDSLDLVTDQILALDIVGLIADGAGDASTSVPEPASLAALGLGLAMIGRRRNR